MVYPTFIKHSDTVGITAPSEGIIKICDLYRLDSAIHNLKEKGFKVKETENVRHCEIGRSGDAIERAQALESLYKDDDVKWIICSGGGNFLLEMLSLTNFDIIKQNPKWLQGYSDPTGLLFPITTMLEIATLYGENAKSFGMNPWHHSIKNNLEIVKGNLLTEESFDKYEETNLPRKIGDEGYNLDAKVAWKNVFGETEIKMEGRIIGGCLDSIMSLVGTRFDNVTNFISKYKDDGIIWFFDCCELTSEDLIRSIWRLNESAWFSYTKGFIFGRSLVNHSDYGTTFEEALQTALKKFSVPVIMDADIGHKGPQMTIINGAYTKIYSCEGKGEITFLLK